MIVWRDQAEHAAESLSKGSRVVVKCRLQQRSWTAENGSARSTVEVVADELGRACGGLLGPLGRELVVQHEGAASPVVINDAGAPSRADDPGQLG